MTAVPVVPRRSKPDTSDLIDEYILNRIDFKARQLAIKCRLPDDHRDDLAQEMVVEVLKAARRFEPGTASWHTYACRVLDMAVRKLAQRQRRVRQRKSDTTAHLLTSCDDWHPDNNEYANDSASDQLHIEMKLDIETVLNRMPPRLQQLCRLLTRLSPAEAARELGIHRSSVYRIMAEAHRPGRSAECPTHGRLADRACQGREVRRP